MIMTTKQKERINQCFRAAYNAFDTHKDTPQHELSQLWQRFLELSEDDPFLQDLLASVYAEIRRKSMK